MNLRAGGEGMRTACARMPFSRFLKPGRRFDASLQEHFSGELVWL